MTKSPYKPRRNPVLPLRRLRHPDSHPYDASGRRSTEVSSLTPKEQIHATYRHRTRRI